MHDSADTDNFTCLPVIMHNSYAGEQEH